MQSVPDEGGDDITQAIHQASVGTASTRLRLTKRTRSIAIGVVAVVLLVVLGNAVVTGVIGAQIQSATLEQADQRRLNGNAQEQARRAIDAAAPANLRLARSGLFPVPIPRADQAPASTVISNAASAEVLATMPKQAIVTEDYVALGRAVRAYFDSPERVITQSGPVELTVSQLAQQYMRVATQLTEDGVLPGSARAPR